ncbi:hypothetical protein [Flaviaesturariibacter aridisoli]|uniref:Outer membrane protein beta-barrel domain-containing protein n=1 Tax=Flaviaesturariibacter aridisoli TaxID=2545761 RepID=A0A4R4E279_9BACT|nr:hypothetical protein [Flaviaesturariibacter aridisoli]TCZ73499.1 hypothetical protein E0486_05935 [Flaviaesturariibacter aridisoli]
MRPSDKVWKGISDNLKRRNRRIGWFTGFFLLAASVSGYLLTQQASPDSTPLGYQQAGEGNSGGGNSTEAAGTETAPSTGRLASGAVFATGASELQNGNNTSGTGANNAATARVTRFRNGSRAGQSASGPIHSNAHGSSISERRNGSDDLDRMYTDASLAEPATGLRAQNNNATAADRNALLARLAPEDRLSVQFFVTPTLSYRSLTENKDFTQTVPQANADPSTMALYNINDAVTHKPSIGLEVGLSAKYAVARNLKIQGGVQFNVSRYQVQAFDNYAPQTATMAYNGGGSTQRSTPYSNIDGGGSKEKLQNMYFQVSAPIGLELKIAGNSRTQFGITSTIQPTYVLSDRVYMLSTDYKTYAEVPWLVRRWNVNTALSTYVGYSTGKLAWQVGPQVRYQLMSSFVSKYPVKENLFDFGLRVGVSLNKGAH